VVVSGLAFLHVSRTITFTSNVLAHGIRRRTSRQTAERTRGLGRIGGSVVGFDVKMILVET